MFRDHHQKCRALRVLLDTVQLGRLWTDQGPTDEAIKLHATKGGYLASSERLIFWAVWDLWDGAGPGCRLSAIVDWLDQDRAVALCTLLIASKSSPSAIDRWIDDPSIRRIGVAPRLRQPTPME